MPEKKKPGIDINQVIRQGTKQTTIADLAKLGHKNVRVIDENRINQLITQAVEQAIESESADLAGREKRQDAEKIRREAQEQLAQYKIEQVQLQPDQGQEAAALKSQIAVLQAKISEAENVIEQEKQRISEESRKKFDELLQTAKAEMEAEKGGYEKALRELIQRSQELIPADEVANLSAVPEKGESDPTKLLNALNDRLGALDSVVAARAAQLEDTCQQLQTQEEDIAIAARMRSEQQKELEAAKAELDEVLRQSKEQEEDMAIAARMRTELQAELDSLREQLKEKEAELGGQVNRLKQEKEVLATDLKSAEDEMTSEIQELKAELDGFKEEAEKARREAEEKLARAQFEHERSLREMVSQLEAASTVANNPALIEALGEQEPLPPLDAELSAVSAAQAPIGDLPEDTTEAGESPSPASTTEILPASVPAADTPAEVSSPVLEEDTHAAAEPSTEEEPAVARPPSAASVLLANAMNGRIQRLARQLATASELLAGREADLQDARDAYASSTEENDSLKASNTELQKNIDDLRRELDQLDIQPAETSPVDGSMAPAAVSDVDGGVPETTLGGRVRRLGDELNHSRLELAAKTENLHAAEKDLADLRREVAEKEERLQAQDAKLRSALARIASTHQAARQAISDASPVPEDAPNSDERSPSEGTTVDLEPVNENSAPEEILGALDNHVAVLSHDLEDARNLLRIQEKDISVAANLRRDLEDQIAGINRETDALRNKLEDSKAALREREKALDQVRKEKKKLSDLVKQLRKDEAGAMKKLNDLAGSLNQVTGEYQQRSSSIGDQILKLIGFGPESESGDSDIEASPDSPDTADNPDQPAEPR